MNKLAEYDSSSDEEALPLPKRTQASQKMPPLSSFFQTPLPETSKDLYQGRKRTVPHQKNSWATLVYFQVDLGDDKDTVLKHWPQLTALQEQHISVSRTVYFQEHQLEGFVKGIEKVLNDIKAFTMSFAQVAQLTNDEKTRSFVTLEVGAGYNELSECMKRVDTIMKQYNQPVFYDPPRFHTSIAWSLDTEPFEIPSHCIDTMMTNTFNLSRLYIKQGNRMNHIDLN